MTEQERDLLVCIGIALARLLLSAPGGTEHFDTLVHAIERVQGGDANRDAQLARERDQTFPRTGAGEQA